MGLGHSAEGSGEPVAPGERQHMGPKGIPSYNGEGGYGGPGQASATDSDKDGVSDQTESTSKGTDDYGGADPGPAGYGGPAGSVADNSSVAEGWGKTETGWGRSGDPATATGKSKPEEKGRRAGHHRRHQ
jgi:hypothetical protein